MLRKIRITVAIISISLITLLFLDITGAVHLWLGFMAKIQFIPAISLNFAGMVIGIIIATAIFGRIYCSIICPLGIMQDIFAYLGKRRKKLPYAFTKPHTLIRFSVLAVFAIGLAFGIMPIVTVLDPYSAFGRICSSILQPIYIVMNNILAYFAERIDSYSFYSYDVWLKSVPVLIIALVTLTAIGIISLLKGRLYCNTICPVGTILGALATKPAIKVTINTDKCINCGLCAKKCKSSCIDAKNHKIDYSRCVVCMDCISECSQSAISFTYLQTNNKKNPTVSNSRRTFLTSAIAFASTGIMKAEDKVDGGLALIEDKKIPKRITPIVPSGAISIKHLTNKCTACQLCISACPNGVLRPSNSLENFMQPTVSYERGYCRPECNRCSQVCPTGAITPVSVEEKSSIQVGHAVWIKENCVVLSDGVNCGNCARHCPTGAITMIPLKEDVDNSPKIPIINTERCIGCGACENLCPARPLSAIYVEGHEKHRNI